MKVEINSDIYLVLWKHSRQSNHISRGKTKCSIVKLYKDENTPLVRLLIGTGETYCSSKDSYNKDVGRKISLTRALQKIFPSNKEIRKAFWNAYYKMKNNKW